jgi:hypothetical protein
MQHAHHQEVRHEQRHEEHERHDNRGRREPRSFDSRTHHRIDSRRYVGDRMEVQFEGYWFYHAAWPVWIFNEDVYFVMGPNNIWFAYEYNNPAVFLQVTLVD